MHEYIEQKLKEARKIIDGKAMYDVSIISELNSQGIHFHFTDKGVRYTF